LFIDFSIPPSFFLKIINQLNFNKANKNLVLKKNISKWKINRDLIIENWFNAFLNDEFIQEIFKSLEKVEIYASLTKNPKKGDSWVREALVINTKNRDLFLVNGFLNKIDSVLFIGKYTNIVNHEKLKESFKERLFYSIMSGKVWSVIEESLKGSGFLKTKN